MRADDQCPFCSEREDCLHLFISCPRARNFWAYLNLDVTSISNMEQLWHENPLQEPNQNIRTAILTCVLWNIWKSRNAKIFRSQDESNSQISARCRDDLLLWSHRSKTAF
ncbi:hypothetical protein HU200_000177 [Digitaria exilis]|uniref:Reverse transcriptase zinc-binding domain-containing protein n=1 Tax=Digitaria exilis TaxID=1010633 RepID=A0A835G0U3_9POAL|nr:hypothetical protein HU200_040278 [Digitaria exilis]KAF8783744.1 hypothetical protein HU200_000177 [Digitaria exilis]